MILIDTLLASGVHWVLRTVADAAAAERDDDTSLRASLRDAAMRVEAGEIDEAEYARIEQDILARLGEIRARREDGPIAWNKQGAPRVEASVAGDFHAAPRRKRPR